MINMAQNEESLRRLARFENLFHRENLKLGLSIWLQTNLVILLLSIPLSIIPMPFEFFFGIVFGLTVYLYQRAAGREALFRYRIPVSPWCWWSINWRTAVYLLPLTILLAVMIVSANPPANEEELVYDPTQMAAANFLIFVFSVVPMGLATSQAFMVSLARFRQLSGRDFNPGSGGIGGSGEGH